MKHFLLFLSTLLILATVVVERSGLAWRWERPLVSYLAQVTGHPLPSITAIKLSSDAAGLLVPQDVALTLRAVVSFYPEQILVAAPLSDLANGPLLLVKEALETGALQKVPIVFSAVPDKSSNAIWSPANILVFPVETKLPQISGKINSSSSLGFIASQDEMTMPLVAITSEGPVASLWWRGLLQGVTEKSMPFLLYGKFLHLPNNAMLPLQAGALLKPTISSNAKILMLEDLLLHREEMERGSIRPDLDLLFRNKTVLIGGAKVAGQAATLEEAIQEASVARLSAAVYGIVLMIFALLFVSAARYEWIDFLLIVIFSFLIYGGLGFWLFRSQGVLLPLLLPVAILFSVALKKWIEKK